MYGMSGGGGQTVGGSGGGGTNAPEAPKGGHEIEGMALLRAQKELIQAQTENVKTDTEYKGGVQTDLTRRTI